MNYAVYINPRKKRATIHTESCIYYMRRDGDVTPSSRWIAGYTNLEKISSVVQRLGCKEIHKCKVCITNT